VGSEPLTAGIELGASGWILRDVRAGIPAARVAAEVRVGLGGELGGAMELWVSGDWLAKSAWLALPALFAGALEIPVVLGGTVREPEIDRELLATFERMLVRNRVTTAVAGVIDEIAHTVTGEPRSEAAPRPRPAATSGELDARDEALDRIVREAADWDALRGAG
jgi:hypothetical protein